MTNCAFRMILPQQIGPDNLVGSNLPVDATPVWPQNTRYSLPGISEGHPEWGLVYSVIVGVRTQWQSAIWECVEAGTYVETDTPNNISPFAPGHTPERPRWGWVPAVFVRSHSINEWAALNSEQGNRTVSPDGVIEYTLSMSEAFNAVSLVHMTHVSSATITAGGQTITQTFPDPETVPWYVRDLVLEGGLPWAAGDVSIRIEGEPGKLSLGSVCVGQAHRYGFVKSPIRRRGKNPGTAAVDPLGYTSFNWKLTSKLLNYTFRLSRHQIDNLERTLHLALQGPAIYIVPSTDIEIVRYAKLNDFEIAEWSGYAEVEMQIESLLPPSV